MPGSAKTDHPSIDPAIYKLAWILIAGMLAPLFDTTIVNVALQTLGRDLHTSVTSIQWVMTAYLLALGGVVPVSAWALDRFGGKRVWMFALSLFLAGSLLSGLSWNIGSLIVFRVLQGVGGGLMLPLMQTLLVRAAGGHNLGRLMATIGLPAVVGPILGPVLGGIIVHGLGWRWMFYINVPVCLIALAWAWRGMPLDKPAHRAVSPDAPGIALLSTGLVSLIYGLAQIGSHARLDGALEIIPTALGVALLTGFVAQALRTRAEPAVDLRLFKHRSFAASISLFFLFGLSRYGTLLLLPLYYQQVGGATVLLTGLLLAPQGIGALLSRIQLGKMVDRLGGQPVCLIGIALSVLGLLPFALEPAHLGEWVAAAALVLLGAGQSALMIPVMVGVYQGIEPERVPHASSATRVVQQIGGAFGAAVIAILLEHQLAGHAVTAAARAAAFGTTFWWSLGFTILALIPALMLPKIKRESKSARAAAPAR